MIMRRKTRIGRQRLDLEKLVAQLTEDEKRELLQLLREDRPMLDDFEHNGEFYQLSRRFYVAHPKILRPDDWWAKATLEEATEHATKLTNLSDKPKAIVQIVRIVRPQPKPVIVEDL
jgi:hypothetical protein